ncbi:MAG TPA: low affinity iron permease family protein [Chitinophagaceae bacterium]|jgi:low affinity Fe/Cu permease|nr:low affinity iron permease family protein [Chitinophagaceae bacterium]
MPDKTFYQRVEGRFEGLVGAALKIYGHPFTFVAAVILVIFFLINGANNYTNLRDFIRDCILCISFLSFFIIQRAMNKSTTATNIKVNELIATHDKANNELVTIEEKTATELEELADQHKIKTVNQSNKNAL